MDSVSIKSVGEVKVQPAAPKVDVKPLTQEDLERYWNEVSAELELTEIMKNATVRMGEHTGCFEVDAQTTYFADEFRSHKIEVLEAMRRKSGMGMLNCKVNPMFVEENAKAYNPDDKYNAMLQHNPNLASLRHLFTEIDY